MRVSRVAVTIALCGLVPVSIAAQKSGGSGRPWVPFTIIQHIKTYGPGAKGAQKKTETRNVFMRSNDGSVYMRPLLSQGYSSALDEPGYIIDGHSGRSYTINYKDKTATPRRALGADVSIPLVPPTALEIDEQHSGDMPLGQKIIGGVRCIGWRITKQGRVTDSWYAPSVDYQPMESTSTEMTSGVTTLISVEKVTLGEPASQYFKIPAGYKVR